MVGKLEKKFTVGKEVECRVIGQNYLDGMVNVAMMQSILCSPFLRIEDVPVGSVVKVHPKEMQQQL